ncbi:ABC transporter permease [Spiroplasma helicoides]|uniref:ABC transporter permease n=1 Tax=Spiroplasma helicoides TaxID=216938 RepID=A0A1B3SL66_9MOLU|nr:hypothetical protein [Spiroplasma helicoides]AOG60660.1 ABC transporter permease [Spiroplasma helicoides]
MGKWHIYKVLFRMQLRNYLRDKFNLFSGWIITLITLVVWLSFRDTTDGGLTYDPFVLAGAIGVCGIRNCLFNFAKTIHEFKNRDFFNRLFSTNISKKFIFFAIVSFNICANFVVTLVTFLIAMIYPEQRDTIKNVNWLLFLVGYFLLLLISNLMAFIIVFAAKKLEWVYTIGNIYYFGSVYLLGLGLPFNVIVTQQWLFYITYLFPQRYMLSIMEAGWINAPSFKYKSSAGSDISFGYGDHPWIPYVASILIVFVAAVIVFASFKKVFEFENRKWKKYKNKNKHLGIIYSISRTTSLQELESLIEVRDSIDLNIKKLNNKLKEIKKSDSARWRNYGKKMKD